MRKAKGNRPTSVQKRSPGRGRGKRRARPDAPDALPAPAEHRPSGPTIVGIGSSAGGVEALTKLFTGVPAKTGMAFVVVQHLDPTHESMLSEILQRATAMPVREISDGMRVSANSVSIIPPNANLTLVDGNFKLTGYGRIRGWHMPIDEFFVSLAETNGPRSVAVVLSGAASDGARGCRSIKAAGGITFAQEEKTARFPEMPHATIASGCADFVLPPEEIGEELGKIGRHPALAPRPLSETVVVPEPQLDPILSILRTRTGVDFSSYRKTTIRRRIQRRMVLHRIPEFTRYAERLRQDKEEVRALYEDILITVTAFFRDPEAFELLKARVFPALLEGRQSDSPIRIWVPGCSTGEEVYSLAITLFDVMGDQRTAIPAQIFATDISERAIERARVGAYPLSISAEVPPDALQKYFARHDGVYQISKTIRDVCIFARQDLGADPPFSNLDLISCRNLLIYMEPYLQKRILPLFHYALKPKGYLLLGSSETIRNFEDLFHAEDKQHRLFSKRGGPAPHVLDFGSIPRVRSGVPRAAFEPVEERGGERDAAELQRRADRVLLGRFSPPGVVVNEADEIVQFRGDTAALLASPSGSPSFGLLKMAREGLLVALRDGVAEARKNRNRVRKTGVRVKGQDGYRVFDIEVAPLGDPGGHLLIIFEDRERFARKIRPVSAQRQRELTIARLEQELSATKEYLQSIIEEQEASREELTSANEEILSSNEELQSTNEELETAKEELQSTNEELTTVNDELQTRNAELSGANNDLTNVLASVNIPMILVDPKLTIRRFTPLAERILNVIPGDAGRPLRDLKPNVDVPDFVELVEDVIRTSEGREREVQDKQGQWYLMRVRPYRTSENKIDGAVVAFLDIDPVKLGLEQVNLAREYAETLIDTVGESLLVVDGSLRVRMANQSFYRTFDTSPLRMEGRRLDELSGWNDSNLRAILAPVLQRRDTVADVEWEFTAIEDEPPRILLVNSRRIRLPSSPELLVLIALQDITDRKRGETRLRESEKRYRRLFEKAGEAVLLIDGQSGRVIDANPFFLEMLGYTADRVVGQPVADLPGFSHPQAPEGAWDFDGGSRVPPEMEIPLVSADGREVWVNRVCSGYASDSRAMVQCNLRDVTAAKLLQRELLQAQKLESMGSLAGGIAHDFNNILTIISGYLASLKRAGDAAKEAESVAAIQSAVDRGAALVRQLLAFARRSEGDAPVPVDVNAIVDELFKMIGETFPKHITCEQELASGLPKVVADPNQIHQALLNLCVNARDAMPEGGKLVVQTKAVGRETVAARFPKAGDDAYVSVAVCDEGNGLDETTRARIFEPFFTTKKDQGGSGLGLAVAYGIVKAHRGFIEARGNSGEGTTFEIFLPAESPASGAEARNSGKKRSKRKSAPSASPPAGAAASAPESAAASAPESAAVSAPERPAPRTVLVVEDEGMLRTSLKELIESEGYRVLTAPDGLEALRIYRENGGVSVVVSDLQMPRLGGWETFLRLRECDPAARVILLSGFFDGRRRNEMVEAGVAACISKPFRPAEMLAAIHQVLDPTPDS